MDVITNGVEGFIGKKFVFYPCLKWGDNTSGVWTVHSVTCTARVTPTKVILSGEMIHVESNSLTEWHVKNYYTELKTPNRQDVIDELKWRSKTGTPAQKEIWANTIKALADESVTIATGGWITPEDWNRNPKIYQPWKVK